MEFATKIVGEKGYIKIIGSLDTESASEALGRAFDGLMSSGIRTVVMDFSSVENMDSHGVGKIVGCYKRLKSQNGVLAVRGLQGYVKELFDVLMLTRLFPEEH